MVRIDMFAIYGKGSNPEGAGESSMLLLISHTLSEVPVWAHPFLFKLIKMFKNNFRMFLANAIIYVVQAD